MRLLPASDGGHLRLNKYSLAYRKRLLQGGVAITSYLKEKGLDENCIWKGKAAVVDDVLEAFVSDLHSKGSQLNKGQPRRKDLLVAKHGTLFVQVFRPRLKHRLNQTWGTLKAWEEMQPGSLRSPLPLPLLMGMICQARVNSETCVHGAESHRWLQFSVLISLGFFGLLRPGEIFQLRRKDITLPNHISLGLPSVTVGIEKPKNFRQLGCRQFTTISHLPTCEWIAWLRSSVRTDDERLWPASPIEFRRLFRSCCRQLHLKEGRYSPASLRAGGATFLFDQIHDVNRLRFLGRWANTQSLEHYIQSAKANMQLEQLKKRAVKRISALLTNGGFLLQLPPRLLKCLPEEHRLDVPSFAVNGPLWRACRNWGGVEKAL